jgi:hypothetical protein
MSETWTILTRRYGADVRHPSHTQLLAAVNELYDENIAGMEESDYAEHPNAFLRSGTDDGPMFVVDAYRSGTVILVKYADQDFGEPSHEVTLTNVRRETLLALWASLVSGDFGRILTECPLCRW